MTKLKEVIAVVNAKGGVGKTTTVQNIAAGIIRKDHDARVLVIDLDAQGNASYLLGWNREREQQGCQTIYDALRAGSALPVYNATTQDDNIRKGLYYVPSSKYLETVSNDLYHHMNSKMVLAQCFRKGIINNSGDSIIESVMDFDYVLIDCPPAMSEVTYNALGVASSLIIPMQLEGMAVQGLADLIAVYKTVKDQLNPNIELMGILKVMTTDRLNTSKGFAQLLDNQFEDKVFQTRIRRSNKINEAQSLRMDIFEYAPYSPAGLDYELLVKEITNK